MGGSKGGEECVCEYWTDVGKPKKVTQSDVRIPVTSGQAVITFPDGHKLTYGKPCATVAHYLKVYVYQARWCYPCQRKVVHRNKFIYYVVETTECGQTIDPIGNRFDGTVTSETSPSQLPTTPSGGGGSVEDTIPSSLGVGSTSTDGSENAPTFTMVPGETVRVLVPANVLNAPSVPSQAMMVGVGSGGVSEDWAVYSVAQPSYGWSTTQGADWTDPATGVAYHTYVVTVSPENVSALSKSYVIYQNEGHQYDPSGQLGQDLEQSFETNQSAGAVDEVTKPVSGEMVPL